MNQFSANYAPNTAVAEYQTSLRAQKANDSALRGSPESGPTEDAPFGSDATYVLRERVPNWNLLLNMGAGKGGLAMYSGAHLAEAQARLQRPEWFTPGDYHFSRLEQLQRVTDELETRHL